MDLPDLPITDVIPALIDALAQRGVAVLQAPPGAGKTTVVPLAMLAAGQISGKILMLEPRRLAARAAAERMAETLGEPVGKTVGYRVRGQSKITNSTRIEVLTEGILTRMIQTDPSLAGVGAVIFDEFHERSLNGDLGLALVWEARSALHEDLQVLVMSATLDAAPVADLLAAPVITSQGRAYAVETRWLARPTAKAQRFEDAVCDLVCRATKETSGGILVFLPGEGEIRRVAARLKGRLGSDCKIQPLYGAMDFQAQRAAIAPTGTGRKLVLATSIAETSLTIAGISTVVDGGLARRARFDPGSGMSQLVTERVTRAEAEQRRGRAGRMQNGHCYRLWTRGEHGGLALHPPAEIESGDLCALRCELALWGAAGTHDLAFLTPPNPGAFAAAGALLQELGALDANQRITVHGRKIATLPLHPRLAHMLVLGGKSAPMLAALLGDRDPMPGENADLLLRKAALEKPGPGKANGASIQRIRAEAGRLARHATSGPRRNWAELAALAYPDRIGLRRHGDTARWILSGGKEAVMDAGDPLAGAHLIVVSDLDGARRQARIRQATEISDAELRGLFGSRICWVNSCHWSRRERRVVARQQELFGALVLHDRVWKDAPADDLAQAALDGVRDLGLALDASSRRFCARVELVRASGADMPDFSTTGLLEQLQDWLLAHLYGVRSDADIAALKLLEPLRQRLSRSQLQMLDRQAPAHFTTPLGRQVAIDYSGEAPEISLRMQEMFGVAAHPVVAGQPLRITLLSPAHRALQTTMDLPGFWAGSYQDVRKDMRGRYPKHPWPQDPARANATLRVKPR